MIPAPELNLVAVAPLAVLAGGAFGVLLADVGLTGRSHVLGRAVSAEWKGTVLSLLSAAILALVALISWESFQSGGAQVLNPAHPMLQLDRLSSFSMALIAVVAALACLLSKDYLIEMRINHGEYYALLLLSTSGMLLLVCAVDLLTLFLGIEILSIPIYVLAGFDRRKLRSNESALKYFLLGSFASAILLYGMALLYGATGATHLPEIRAGFAAGGALSRVGLGLVLVGFTFKISCVPFHQWTPDVYEGAPTSVTAYMSTSVKVAAFVALLRLVEGAFGESGPALAQGLGAVAVLTMAVGAVMALIQDNVKRLLAYSSIGHAGFALVALVVGTPEAHSALLFYLLVYVFMNLGAFAVLAVLSRSGRDADRIGDLAGLARGRPVLAALMTLFVLSLAGIPPTGGFLAKFQLFMAAVSADHIALAIVMALTTLVSLYYYLRIPVAMYMWEPGDTPRRAGLSSAEATVLALCALLVLFLGLVPNAWLPFLDWVRDSAASL